MNLSDVKSWIKQNNLRSVEDAWLEAIETNEPPETFYTVLQALTAAGHDATATTLATMAVGEFVEKRPPAEALKAVRGFLPAAPPSDELRIAAAELYRKALAGTEHLDVFLAASGLETNCSLRRAIAAMDICLCARLGSYLVNPHESGQVLRVERFDAAGKVFELTDPHGGRIELDPPSLADDYRCTADNDFRVLASFRREQLPDLLAGDPGAVLTGICMAHGGQIDAGALKDLLVPKYLDAGAWSGWWGRARTAVKKSHQLVLEGRSPAVVKYHPHGLSLEEELAPRLGEARTPADLYAVALEYLAQAPHRDTPLDSGFSRGIMNTLAEQARQFRQRRPTDALVATLAIEALVRGGLPHPQSQHPSAAEAVAELSDAAASIAALSDAALRDAALDALALRSDAAEQFTRLFPRLGVESLDDLARRAGGSVVDAAMRAALADPVTHLQTLLWLWRGPAEAIPNCPPPLELLPRVLGAGETVAREILDDRDFRRESFHHIRSALVADDCRTFRKAAAAMTEGVGAAMKRRVERNDALSESTRPRLLAILRERFYKLFLETKVAPWLDETVLWTTEGSLRSQEAVLKELEEITLPANSKRIGEAAEKGDLSENSDWLYAIEEQRRLQAKVSALKGDLVRSRVLHADDVPADTVSVGSRVTLRRCSDGSETDISLLGPWESDVATRIFNYQTPLALSLMGKRIGQRAVLKLEGAEEEYEIVALSAAIDPAGRVKP
ncbi:MAG: GreA/GreB family elongation factor [Planctomycetaceae bacterium]|nr:GreA/GreB family elongation factor [Planctomycetaceae bacterium]